MDLTLDVLDVYTYIYSSQVVRALGGHGLTSSWIGLDEKLAAALDCRMTGFSLACSLLSYCL